MRVTIAKAVVLVLLCAVAGSGQEVIMDQPGAVLFQVTPPGNFDFLGGGSRAEGMGKAFYGLSDDASAVSWNPAGLMDVDDMMTGFALSSFLPRGEVTLTGDQASAPVFEQSGSFDHVTLFSFISPLRIKGHPFVGSISYTRVGDDYSNGGAVNEERYLNFMGDSADARGEGVQEFFSGLNAVNLGFGTRLYREVSFGFSLNIYNGTATSVLNLVNVFDDWARPGDPQTAQRVVTTKVIDSMTYSGVNFTVGFKYGSDRLNAGLVIKTPHKLEVDSDSSTFAISRFAGLVETGSTDTVYSDNHILEYEIPMTVGIGFGYRATEKLTLAADFEYRPYDGQLVRIRDSVKIIPGENDEEYFSERDPAWNNVLTARLGGEYMWETGSKAFPVVPVRAGFGYLPIPYPDLTLNDSGEISTDKITGYSFSFGSGVHWDQIKLDFAYTYSTQDQKTVLVMFGQDVSNRTHHLSATFTGIF